MGWTSCLGLVRRFLTRPVVALVAVCLALAGVALTVTTGAHTAGAVDGQPSGTLSKAGKDVNTGSTSQVRAGDTIRWAASARNTSGVPAGVAVTDPVGTGQTFVPGSLQAPPGYREQWSTDGGASYADTDQGTATNQVRVSAEGVPDQSTGATNPIPAPASSFGVGVVGGDGWEAIFYADKVYNVHHHHGAGGTTFFDCHFKSGGQSCPGFPVGGTNASITAGTQVGAGPDDYLTPEEARTIVSPGGRMYTPVQVADTTRTGFACVDLTASPPVSCGLLTVATDAPLSVPGGGSGVSALGGGAVVGSKLYSMTWDGRLVCLDSAAGAFCDGAADGIVGMIDPGVASRSGANHLWPSQHAQFTTVGGIMAGIVDTQSGQTARNNVDIVCYDLNRNRRCTGFPLVNAQPIWGGSAAPILDTAGDLTGVCTQDRAGAPFPVYCYDLSGNLVDDPYPARPAGTSMGAFAVGDPLVVGTRVYSPYSDTRTQNFYRCFDFATGAPCATFSTYHTVSTARPYTIRQDPYVPNCLWELGDGGIFENFDATTGSSGCSDTAAEIALNPGAYYCDGGAGHVQGWGSLRVTDLPPNRYSAVLVTVLDSAGRPVSGYAGRPLPDDGQLSLSAIPASGATASLTVRLTVFGADQAGWQGHRPAVTLTFTGDAPQVCLRTTAATICNAVPGTLDDTATLVVTAGGSSATEHASAALTYLFPTADCPRRLAFAKQADSATAGPGDTVHYTVTVRNTGLVDFTAASPATFTDNLAEVLDDAAYNDDATATAGTVSYAAPVLSWSGPLAHGDSVTIRYSVTIDRPDTGDHRLTNTVIGPPDVDSNCRPGDTAPACTVAVPVADLRVVKTADPTTVDPGGTVAYTITVSNIGQVPYTAADPATVTDDLTQVLDDAAYNDDAVASSGTVSYTAPTLSWRGALAPGATATIRYTVTVHDPDAGDRVLTNVVVGGTNCPPGSTDPACRAVVPSPHLTVAKAADRPQALPGDKVTYTLTVHNDGAVAFTAANPAELTDDLSAVLDDATYGDDAAASAGTVSYAAPVLHWTGPLAIGDTVTITYSVTVKLSDTADHRMPNTVVVPHSNCAASATDPACSVLVLVPDLDLVKSADHTVAAPGDRVVYTITVTNIGQADYTAANPAAFTDDLTNVLDDATYAGDAASSAGAVTYAAPILSWSGPLGVGQSAVVTYSVVVDSPPGGDAVLTNVVIGPPYSRCAPGSGDPACTVQVPVPIPPPGGGSPTPTPVPTPTVAPPPGSLPNTGVNVAPLGWWAALLVGAGGLLVGAGAVRRRRQRAARR
jgi:uncharacterized repeat protein (TIGR01451 family)